MPTLLATFSHNILTPAQFPENSRWTAGRFAPNLTLAAGTVVGKVTATGLLAAYATGNADGTETAVGLLMYPVNTDANGNVFFGGSTTPNGWNAPMGQTAPYFVGGVFDTADLTGYDAAALADMGGRVLANGFISIPL